MYSYNETNLNFDKLFRFQNLVEITFYGKYFSKKQKFIVILLKK